MGEVVAKERPDPMKFLAVSGKVIGVRL